MRIVRTT